MASKIDLQYIYQNIDSTEEFQLIVEELTNQLIRYHNDENQEVTSWFLAQINVRIANIVVIVETMVFV